MGNAASDAAEADAMARVAALRDELQDMERAVRHLSGRARGDALQPHEERVHGHTVACAPGVRVLLGPVVGKVDFQSARVLLEVDRATRLTCHVLVHDERTGASVEATHCSVCVEHAPARKPTVFRIYGLVPDRRYRVVFSGVHTDDARRCTGSFRTPTLAAGGALQCAVVSADDPSELNHGERSLWVWLRRAIVDEQRVHMVIHLGGQVSMKRMFDKAWALLVRHAECTQPPVTARASEGSAFTRAWTMLEDEAMEILRSAYRTQWTIAEDKAQVLANASNLMMWSDWDVYPLFTTSASFFIDHERPTLEMQVLRTVARCARRLFQEYQRALWDDEVEQVFSREAEMRLIAEQALATTARLYILSSQQLPAAQDELELQKKRRDIEGARKAERHLRALEAEKVKTEKTLVSYNQVLAPQGGEEFFFAVGPVGVLILDMRTARVEPGGSQQAGNELLSTEQWIFIERTLEMDDIKVLIVATEVPLVDDLPHELRVASAFGGECDFRTWWGSNTNAQQRILSLLFEWKLQQESREVFLLSGSCNTRFAMKTTVHDIRLRTELTQWMTGPITARANGRVVPSREGILFDRFSFQHDEIETIEKSLLILELSHTPVGSNPTVKRFNASVVHDAADVLLGPVIGHVDDVSAVVLIEVDREADVVCLVNNVLTGECRRVFQHFSARQPNSFFINHLRSEHHYEIVFERINGVDMCRGSFTTLPKTPERFDLVATGDTSREVPHAMNQQQSAFGQSNCMWSWISENLASGLPFRGVQKTVHVGLDIIDEAQPLHFAIHDETQPEDNYGKVSEQLREIIRTKWRMPGTRELLCRGSHMFLHHPRVDTQHLDSQSSMIRKCIGRVYQEYENALLPPSMRVGDPKDRLENPIRFIHGRIGQFVLPPVLFEVDLDPSAFWTRFEIFLQNPHMVALVLISAHPFVEDSTEDAEEKARFDNTYRSTLSFQYDKLSRVLEMLTKWQVSGGRQPRRVAFVAGHRWRSFETIIQSLTSPESIPQSLIQQFVIGPFSQCEAMPDKSESLQLNVFPQGVLFGKFGYFHRFHHPPNRCTTKLVTESSDGAASNEAEAPSAETPVDPFAQMLLLTISFEHKIDDIDDVVWNPRFLVSEPTNIVPPNTRAYEKVGGATIESLANSPQSSAILDVRQPDWLSRVVTEDLNEIEQATLHDIDDMLEAKSAEIGVSYKRADGISSGIVSGGNRAHFVVHLKDAITDFVDHLVGVSFRSKYPSIPSPYVINYSIQELVEADSSLLAGAIDADQYQKIVIKSLQNAWLFTSRLHAYWS